MVLLGGESGAGKTRLITEFAAGLAGQAGELTVRDVTRPVTLAIGSVESAGAGFQARAATRIDRYAYGLTASTGMAARYLGITVSVTAQPW